MPRLVVFCALCGYEPGIELEVSADATPEEMRAAMAAHTGTPSMRCERCRSELLPESGVLTTGDPPRLELARKAERMRKRIRGVRFAVGSTDGPRGSVWRIWVNRNDVYVAARVAASEMKVSLHASGKWRSAFTERHVQREDALISSDRDRAVDKWERPAEFAPGWTRAFVIVVPASEVVPSAAIIPDPQEIIWIDPLPEGWATIFTVLLSAPDATGSDGRGFATAAGREHFTEVVTAIELENGGRAWVVAHAEELSDEWRRNLEALRGQVLQEGAKAIVKARQDPQPHDLCAPSRAVTTTTGRGSTRTSRSRRTVGNG
jgi:hypothetical protein